MSIDSRKVVVVGCGFVGSSSAFARRPQNISAKWDAIGWKNSISMGGGWMWQVRSMTASGENSERA